MGEISRGERDYVNGRLRDAAIVLDEAEHATDLRKGDANFRMATGVLRAWRRSIESTTERTSVVQQLRELDNDLSLVGGASAVEAVSAARRLVGDAHFKLASAREE